MNGGPCVKCIICPLMAEHAILETLLASAAHNVAKIPDSCIDAWTARLKAIDGEIAEIEVMGKEK